MPLLPRPGDERIDPQDPAHDQVDQRRDVERCHADQYSNLNISHLFSEPTDAAREPANLSLGNFVSLVERDLQLHPKHLLGHALNQIGDEESLTRHYAQELF